jgi:hypothetical protein
MKKYFAEINTLNIVQKIVTAEKVEDLKLSNLDYRWIETSKTGGNIRKNPASVGDFYDENRDAFIRQKPFNSWVLNETTCKWEAPVAKPVTYTISDNDPERTRQPDPYRWDEEQQNWILISLTN